MTSLYIIYEAHAIARALSRVLHPAMLF